MDGNNFIQLKSLIKEAFGIDNINMDTEINMLDSVSEDNDYFINLLKTKLNIDMSTFKYYDYFEEDEFILISIFRRIFKKRKKNRKVLTIAHLLLVINKGEWFEPEY